MRHWSLIVLSLTATACSDSMDEGSGPPTGLTPAMTMASPSGDGQQAPPGTQLEPFRVRILKGTTPQPGFNVSWTFIQGTGNLSATTSTTDASGIATTRLTLGAQAGLVQVRASATGVSGSPVTFTATAVVPGQLVTVEVLNNQFEPASVTIAPGGTVVFHWPSGSQQHDIRPVAPNTIPSQPSVTNGPFTFEQTFPTAGTYNYFCSVHGSANSGMRGTVVVQ